MSDNAFLFHVLEDQAWHSQNEILDRSMRERGCGLTVHSRVADLRKKHNCTIDNEIRRTGSGRKVSYYRMVVALDEPATPHGELDADAQAVSLAAGSSSAPCESTLEEPSVDRRVGSGAAPGQNDGPALFGVADGSSSVPEVAPALSAVSPPPAEAGTLFLFPEPARGAYGDAA